MNETTPSGPIHLGFLTIIREGAGYLGGFLVTNTWGRPVEFRLSTAVQPNRIQQILYGSTLDEYVCADLIGKTLIDKTAVSIQLLLTDSLEALPIRTRLDVPVVAVAPQAESAAAFLRAEQIAWITHERSSMRLFHDARQTSDAARIREILERIDPGLDVSEPFARIREAMAEARKLGVTNRAA